MEPADLFLSRLIETSWFSPLWRKIRYFVSQKLESVSFQELSLDPAFEKLLLLHICGPSMRKQWNMSDEYRPELLLEPYVSNRALTEMQTKGLTQLCGEIARLSRQQEVHEELLVAARCRGVGGLAQGARKESDGPGAAERSRPEQELLLLEFRSDMVRVYNRFLHLMRGAGTGDSASTAADSKPPAPVRLSGAPSSGSLGASACWRPLSSDAGARVERGLAHSTQVAGALLTTSCTQDLVVSSLITVCFEPHMLSAADCVSVQAFPEGSNNHSGSSYVRQMRLHPLDPSADVADLDALLAHFRKTDVDFLARRFLGKYLPVPLRQCILTYRCLHRSFAVPVDESAAAPGAAASTVGPSRSEPAIVCVNELLRQGALKGVHDIVDRCPRSDLVSRMVLIALVQSASASVDPLAVVADCMGAAGAAPTTATATATAPDAPAAAASASGGFQVTPELLRLARRTEHLVYASYLLSSTVTARAVNVALLLMRMFPEDSPVSEKILRLFRRLTQEVLPSEQLHREYSVGSVAMQTFDLLFDRDREFYDRFLHHSGSGSVPASEATSLAHTATSAQAEGGADGAGDLGEIITDKKSLLKLHHSRSSGLSTTASEDRPLHPPVLPGSGAATGEGPSPFPALDLLKGWLETGFAGGWFSLHTTLYLWDVLMCVGWDPHSGVTVTKHAATGQSGGRGSHVATATPTAAAPPAAAASPETETAAPKMVPATVETVIAKLCFVLLQLLRKPLLARVSGRSSSRELAAVLRAEGFKLRTKVVAEAVMTGFVHGPDLRVADARARSKYDSHREQLRRLQQAEAAAAVRTQLARAVVTDSFNASENSVLHQLVPKLSPGFVWSPEGPTSTSGAKPTQPPSGSSSSSAPGSPSAAAEGTAAGSTDIGDSVDGAAPAADAEGRASEPGEAAEDSRPGPVVAAGAPVDSSSAPAQRPSTHQGLEPTAPASPRTTGKFSGSRPSSSQLLLSPAPATQPGSGVSTRGRSPVLTEEQVAARPPQDVIDREVEEFKRAQRDAQQPPG